MNVQIKAIAQTEIGSTKSGLTAQLYREKENEKVEFLKSITVPIQGKDSVSGELVKVDAGKYILQVLLPDGRTITKDFEVESVGQKLLIYLPHEGPHEWTSLHAMAGNFRREAQLPEDFTKSLSDTPKRSYKSLSRNLREGFELSFLKTNENLGDEIFVENKTIENLSNLIQKNLDVETATKKFGTTLKIEEPTQEDTDFAMFRIAYPGDLSKWEPKLYTPRGEYKGHSRHYLLQKSYLGGTLISLPIPWRIRSENKDQAEMEFLVKKNTAGESLEFAMTINEPMISTVLGYINVGAIQQAAQLISAKQAGDMLFKKMENPFAAAVGAYLLILGSNHENNIYIKDRWKDWVNNLDKWFEWLPDGAILNAARHFWLRDYSRDNLKDFTRSYNKSLKALNRSYDRGLPFFTFGLKLMMDGFRYFANEGEDQAKERLAVLQTIANQTDPSQPFLTITFSHHW